MNLETQHGEPELVQLEDAKGKLHWFIEKRLTMSFEDPKHPDKITTTYHTIGEHLTRTKTEGEYRVPGSGMVVRKPGG